MAMRDPTIDQDAITRFKSATLGLLNQCSFHWLKKPLLPGNLVTTGDSHDVAIAPDSAYAQGDDHTHGCSVWDFEYSRRSYF
jgi:hypothetical protein